MCVVVAAASLVAWAAAATASTGISYHHPDRTAARSGWAVRGADATGPLGDHHLDRGGRLRQRVATTMRPTMHIGFLRKILLCRTCSTCVAGPGDSVRCVLVVVSVSSLTSEAEATASPASQIIFESGR